MDFSLLFYKVFKFFFCDFIHIAFLNNSELLINFSQKTKNIPKYFFLNRTFNIL